MSTQSPNQEFYDEFLGLIEEQFLSWCKTSGCLHIYKNFRMLNDDIIFNGMASILGRFGDSTFTINDCPFIIEDFSPYDVMNVIKDHLHEWFYAHASVLRFIGQYDCFERLRGNIDYLVLAFFEEFEDVQEKNLIPEACVVLSERASDLLGFVRSLGSSFRDTETIKLLEKFSKMRPYLEKAIISGDARTNNFVKIEKQHLEYNDVADNLVKGLTKCIESIVEYFHLY